MIVAERESHVICETCGQPAIRRTVEVRFAGKGGAGVSYDTHTRSLTDDEHHAAIQRMEGFFQRVFELRAELNVAGAADQHQQMEFGTIQSYDIDTVHPDACSRRSEVRVVALVRAFGMATTATGPVIPLVDLTAESARSSVQGEAEACARQLKARFDKGQF